MVSDLFFPRHLKSVIHQKLQTNRCPALIKIEEEKANIAVYQHIVLHHTACKIVFPLPCTYITVPNYHLIFSTLLIEPNSVV